MSSSDLWDDPIDEYPPAPVKQTFKKRAKKSANRVKPFVPYALLAWSLAARSQRGVLVSIFALVATTQFQRNVSVINCSFVARDTAPGLVVK